MNTIRCLSYNGVFFRVPVRSGENHQQTKGSSYFDDTSSSGEDRRCLRGAINSLDINSLSLQAGLLSIPQLAQQHGDVLNQSLSFLASSMLLFKHFYHNTRLCSSSSKCCNNSSSSWHICSANVLFRLLQQRLTTGQCHDILPEGQTGIFVSTAVGCKGPLHSGCQGFLMWLAILIPSIK